MNKDLPSSLLKQIEQAAVILKQGGVIAFPTETVYGLGISISTPEAASRIYQIKGRSKSKALSLILSDVSQLSNVAAFIPEIAWSLIYHFWPGPLTLVLTRAQSMPLSITAGGDTIAVRVSSHPVAQAIVKEHGVPITATSANISGKLNLVTAQEVKTELGSKVDLIVDGGKCPGGPESTIIDVTQDVPVIIREGAITREAIQSICKIL